LEGGAALAGFGDVVDLGLLGQLVARWVEAGAVAHLDRSAVRTPEQASPGSDVGDPRRPVEHDPLDVGLGKVRNDLSADAVIKSVGVCSALGRTSAYTWMKLPVVPDMERVMDSTTFPTLLLGGDPDTSPEETFASWRAALQLPSVRGLVVGRTLLYPDDDDVAGAVDTAAALVR
jgi:hypothetical protein